MHKLAGDKRAFAVERTSTGSGTTTGFTHSLVRQQESGWLQLSGYTPFVTRLWTATSTVIFSLLTPLRRRLYPLSTGLIVITTNYKTNYYRSPGK